MEKPVENTPNDRPPTIPPTVPPDRVPDDCVPSPFPTGDGHSPTVPPDTVKHPGDSHHPPIDPDQEDQPMNATHQLAPEAPLLDPIDGLTLPEGMTPLARELWVVASRTAYGQADNGGYYNRLARVAREFVEAGS